MTWEVDFKIYIFQLCHPYSSSVFSLPCAITPFGYCMSSPLSTIHLSSVLFFVVTVLEIRISEMNKTQFLPSRKPPKWCSSVMRHTQDYREEKSRKENILLRAGKWPGMTFQEVFIMATTFFAFPDITFHFFYILHPPCLLLHQVLFFCFSF